MQEGTLANSIAGGGEEREFSRRVRCSCAEGAERRHVLPAATRGGVSIDDARSRSVGPIVIDTVGPGRRRRAGAGWPPPFRWTVRRAGAWIRSVAVAVDGACLRTKALDDPSLGFALLSRVSVTLLSRLQATRMRLLDLYGDQRGH
jgi:hypothetical protein